MVLAYKKITEEEDKSRHLFPKGEYNFSIRSVVEKKTKNGSNNMLEIELLVKDSNGREMIVKDWIVLVEQMGWKLRHFSNACNLLDKYDSQLLEARDFFDKKGIVKLTIREYQSETGMRTVNSVEDYIKSNKIMLVKNESSIKPEKEFMDDDIPF
jgi:hypothetical protein